MAYIFGDSFDCYATPADTVAGYWDSGTTASFTLQPGRFTGSQCLRSASTGAWLVKSSAVNDAVHHIVCAVWQNATLSGSTLGLYLQLSDAATNQVCINFRSDGAILLTSATPGGTTLATYTGAISAQSTWTAFEFEVVISATVGRFRARKNGNTSDDFDSGATLNTRPGTNAYANKLTLGQNATVTSQQIDDILWRSDASSVPFVGDVRCYTRMPVSDASVQFAKSPTSLFAQTSSNTSSSGALSANNIRATPVTCPTTGTLASLTFTFNAGITGRAKMALYDATGAAGGAGALLASSAELTNPGSGTNTFTVTGGPIVTRGVTYWVALWSDVSITGPSPSSLNPDILALTYTTSFPPTMAGFTTTAIAGIGSNGMNVVPTNAALVNEALQDGTATYVFDSTVGHADFYNLAPLAVTPASVVAVITRGFVEKSDAGARTGAVQLKSGGTTVASAAPALSTTFGWLWRADTTDPATGSAWTAAGVNAATIGPSVVT